MLPPDTLPDIVSGGTKNASISPKSGHSPTETDFEVAIRDLKRGVSFQPVIHTTQKSSPQTHHPNPTRQRGIKRQTHG
jgi:hypothetical protein